MKVVHIAFECAPIYKTGGLGDVVGSLPKELKKLGIDPIVVIPGYDFIKHPKTLPGSNVPVVYVKHKLFDSSIKGHDPRVHARAFAAFSQATLEELKRQNIKPDILHCHDWHASLIPFILKKRPDAYFEKTKTIITIHNIAFQGNFLTDYLNYPDTKAILDLFDPRQKKIPFLKAGIESADFITTVSPNHAREIRRGAGFGLESILKARNGMFKGIINGIDYAVWNPRKDPFIFTNYDDKSVTIGKKDNKTHLQKALRLEVNPDIPLLGFVARLSSQKGCDLLLPIIDELHKKRVQLVILGTGEKKYEDGLKTYQNKKDRKWISLNIGFDEKLAHQIYAAVDFFLIPSHYEPCGLTQMISMAYATLPIASNVGGLKDTITDDKTGFLFTKMTSEALLEAVGRATLIWENTQVLGEMRARVLREDFSWTKSARKYLRLYNKLLK